MEGFIKIHRKITEWEWYDDINTCRLFIHLLLKANWKDKKRHGIDIKRGQYLTSLGSLNKETGLSIQEIRTSISKLKSTGEITQSSTSNYSLIQVNNYEGYQTEQHTEQQPSNKPSTTTEEIQEEKENNIYDESIKQLIIYWNNIKKEDSKWKGIRDIESEDLKNTLKPIFKKYNEENIERALINYRAEIKKRDNTTGYYNHRFTIQEFFTRKGGFKNFYNLI